MNDYKTPEFWMTVIVNIASAVIALLVSRGALSPDEGPLWVDVVEVVAVPVALLVMALVTRTYLAGQAQVRVALMENETARIMASQSPRMVRTFTGPYDVTVSSASTGGTPV